MDRQTITVDIAPGSGPIQRIRLSQGDIGRQLGVYIIQNGAAVDCSGYSAHLYVLKPDGNYYEKSCSISSNLITWTTAAQETPLAGECKAQIRITASGQDIGTANFIEAIEATPAAGGTASESLISSMTQYVDAAETAARTAVEAEDTVEDIISTYSGIPGRVTNAENSLSAVEDGLAIVANGNTHAAIASGQFVYVKNHGSLAEGLYVANSAIATNAALTTSNLTADGSGGLNALKAKIGNVGNTDLQSQVTSLNSKINFGMHSTLPTGLPTSGVVGFGLSSNVTLDGQYIPSGARFVGYMNNNIGHFTGEYNGADILALRYAAGTWSFLYSVNSNLSAKATVVKTGWGTQVDVPSNHAIIMLNANVRIQVWLGGSAGVSIWFNRQPTSGQHIEYYKEEASNTATFGITAADGTEFSITRNVSTFSFTASQSYTIKALY